MRILETELAASKVAQSHAVATSAEALSVATVVAEELQRREEETISTDQLLLKRRNELAQAWRCLIFGTHLCQP